MKAKRTNLRTKAAKTPHSPKIQEKIELPEDPKAFLHKFKQTKREKQLNKHDKLISKLNNKSGIKKSKKSVQKLPQMDDLLTVLNNDKNINILPKKEFINKNVKNLPNPKNQSGIKFIQNQERVIFNNVLKDSNFKKNPFSALRENINQRINSL